MKAGVFIGPQIRLLSRDPQFDPSLSDDQKAAWYVFRKDVTGFLGNIKAIHCRKLVEDLIISYEKLECSMSLTMHFLRS
jgi:hypothetical protein